MENYYNSISSSGLNEIDSYIINNYNNITYLGSIKVSSNSTFLRNLNVGRDAIISGISVFNINSNINSLSSTSYVNISGLTANLNSLSGQSFLYTNYTNLNSLNVSSTTKFNGSTCKRSLNIVVEVILIFGISKYD